MAFKRPHFQKSYPSLCWWPIRWRRRTFPRRETLPLSLCLSSFICLHSTVPSHTLLHSALSICRSFFAVNILLSSSCARCNCAARSFVTFIVCLSFHHLAVCEQLRQMHCLHTEQIRRARAYLLRRARVSTLNHFIPLFIYR